MTKILDLWAQIECLWKWPARLGFVLIAAWLAYFGLQPPWLTYTNSPFPVVHSPLHAGDSVQMWVAKCNSSKYPRQYLSSRQLISDDDPKRRPIPMPGSEQGNVAADTCQIPSPSASTSNVIPYGTPPGRYHLEGFSQVDGEYRSRLVPWESQTFEVAP